MQLATPLHYETPRFTGVADGSDEVEVSLLCGDVVRFSEMTARLGDAAALRVMRQVADTVREAARGTQGELLEIRGDGFLLAFDSPAGAGRCALRVLRELASASDAAGAEPVHFRMALHAGPAVRDGEGYFGRSLILAYRLLSRAQADQIAVSASVAKRLPGSLRARAAGRGRFRPKGFANEVDYVLLERSNPRWLPVVRLRPRRGELSLLEVPCFASAHGAD